jgi:hypothetical protein
MDDALQRERRAEMSEARPPQRGVYLRGALPSTTITLSWREEAEGKLRLLDITYEAANSKFLSPFLD